MLNGSLDERAYNLEQGIGLRRRSIGALSIAVLIHVGNLATGDGATVGLGRAIPLRALALLACAGGFLTIHRARDRRVIERALGPLWLLQFGVLASMQWLSPNETLYPWAGAITFGAMMITLGSGFSPRWSALLLAAGLMLPSAVLVARLGTASDMPMHAIVAAAVVAAARGRERLARAEFSARIEAARLHEERLDTQRRGFVEELHDGAAAGIARAASLLDRASRAGDAAALRSARAELDAALREARALMNDLDEPEVGWSELAAELRRALLDSAEGASIRASFNASGLDETRVDESLAHALRRGLREGVSNALRHADARSIHARLDRRDGRVELLIEDDGRGVFETSQGGRGLDILEARARRLRGELAVERRAAGGTRLRLSIPDATREPGGSTPSPLTSV